MRFYNHRSSAIFDIYLKLYDSELSFEKKKLIFKSLLVGESWSWKVTGISKLCLESFKKNKFEKSRKIKTKRRTIKNVIRHQLTNVDDTIKDIFFTKRTKEEWWDKILTEEKTHLVTKDELKEEYYLFTDIPEDGGYFINGTTGYLYSNKEKLLLKPDEIFIKRDKGELAQYQGKPNVLIDDRPHNIEDWQNNGGKAIRFQANEDPIDVVKDALKEIF